MGIDLDMAPCSHIIAHMETDMNLDVAPCLHITTHMEPYYTAICLPTFTLNSTTKMI